MDALLIALVAVAIAVCVVAIAAMLRSLRAVEEARSFVSRLDERLMPLLEKADVTVDALNAELLRVDGIVTQFEDASERVGTTARVARDAVGTPMRVIAGAGEGLARLFSGSRRRGPAEHGPGGAKVGGPHG